MEDLASLKIGARDVHMVKEQHTRVNRSLQKELTNDMLCVTINIEDREKLSIDIQQPILGVAVLTLNNPTKERQILWSPIIGTSLGSDHGH